MVSTLKLKRQLVLEFNAVNSETRGAIHSRKLTREGALARLDVLEGILARFHVASKVVEDDYESWGYVDNLVKTRLERKSVDEEFSKVKDILKWFIDGPSVSLSGIPSPSAEPSEHNPDVLKSPLLNPVAPTTDSSQTEVLKPAMATGGSSEREEILDRLRTIDEERETLEATLHRLEDKERDDYRERREESLRLAEAEARRRRDEERERLELEVLKKEEELRAAKEALNAPLFVDKTPLKPERDLMAFPPDIRSSHVSFDPRVSSTPYDKPDRDTRYPWSSSQKPSPQLPELYNNLAYKDYDYSNLVGETMIGINDPTRFLSKIPLTKFGGDKRLFPGWWSAFTECVDKAPLPDTVKLLRLRGCLIEDSEAERCVAGLGYSAEAYSAAKSVLNRKYGGMRRQLTLLSDELYSFKPIRDNNAQDLERLSELLDRVVVNLKGSENPGELGTGFLYNGILRKMNPTLLTRYQRWMVDNHYPASVSNLRFFIHQESEFLTMANESLFGISKPDKRKKSETRTMTASRTQEPASDRSTLGSTQQKTYTKTDDKKKECRLCKKDHNLWECPDFKKKTVQERWSFVNTSSSCLKCLGGHPFKKCWRKKKCPKEGCSMPHHELLHEDKDQTKEKTQDEIKKEDKTDEAKTTEAITHHVKNTDKYVCFRTVPVWLGNGVTRIRCNALLDEASDTSYISEAVVKHLGLEGEQFPMDVKAVGDGCHSIMSSIVSCTLTSEDEEVNCEFIARSLPVISDGLTVENINITKNRWEHLSDIRFPKPEGKVLDLLIGLDYAFLMVGQGGDVVGKPGQPTARKTPLGWTCVGTFDRAISYSKKTTRTHFTMKKDPLHQTVERFWEQENYGISCDSGEHPMTASEKIAWDIASKTLSYDEKNKRYKVGIPWKETPKISEERCYDQTYKRLVSVEKKLRKNPKVGPGYCRIFKDYQLKGYIKKTKIWKLLLPHFPVVRDHAETTKIRSVFDASAETDGMSLNDFIHVGPKLQRCLVDVLLRFRRNAIAVSCDVREMYLQILLLAIDCLYHCILWRDMDDSKEPEVFQFQRVMFGANASPFLAQFVSQKNAEKFLDTLPRAAEMILQGTYMDDGHDSVHDVEEAKKLIQDVTTIWNHASMNVHKWLSNSPEVLATVPEEARCTKVDLTKNELPKSKTLGAGFDAEKDILTFMSENRTDNMPTTKRGYLKVLAAVFDPLGLLAPVIVRGKMLLQRCWIAGTDWDETLPDSLIQDIQLWVEDLKHLSKVEVPRMLNPSRDHSLEIHTFCDASDDGLGTIAYSVARKEGLEPWVNLVAGKSKVAPLQYTTTPRLELQASVIGTRLSKKIATALDVPESLIFIWVDSTDVLFWVTSLSREFKTFVAHRISEIQSLLNPKCFGHVAGKLNPADVVSRGASIEDLLKHPLYWKGPEFIAQDKENWPKKPDTIQPKGASERRKTSVFTFHNVHSVTNVASIQDSRLDSSRWSSLLRLLRTVATVARAILRWKKEDCPSGPLTGLEIQEAKEVLLRDAQKRSFAEELKEIKAGCISTRYEIAQLKPFICTDTGLIRANTRLVHGSSIPWDMRYPVVLPSDSSLTRLIIRDVHEKNGHCGPGLVLSEMLRRYWLFRPREIIRTVINDCTMCKKWRAKPLQPIMAPLPESRLEHFGVPFELVSLDFAGPFFTMAGRGRPRHKRYLCLYTCLHVRAVHLEMVDSLSAQDFLMAFSRITDRRGVPKIAYSDNGTNLVGGVSELKHFDGILEPDTIIQGTQHLPIDWRFQPPSAPHFSGVHESLVKSAKTALKKILPQSDVTDQELRTAFCHVEKLLNCRPLTYQTMDPKDLNVLTPGDFIIGKKMSPLIPDQKASGIKNLRLRWRYVQGLIEEVWDRWLVEWTASLSKRPKWLKEQPNLKKDDVVLMVEPNLPRGSWKLGRVLELFPGKDDVVRVVDVKTSSGILRRPVVKLCLLEAA